MKPHRKILPVIAAVFFTVALPLAAFTLVELSPNQQRIRVAQGQSFHTQVQITSPVLCDGSVKLVPGGYNLEVSSLADGSVRGSFFDKSGRKVGEAHGIIAVLIGLNTATHASTLPAVQQGPNTKTAAHSGSGGTAPALSGNRALTVNGALNGNLAPASTFASIGLLPSSKSSFNPTGGKMNLEISSADGTHKILIALLLPAVSQGAGH